MAKLTKDQKRSIAIAKLLGFKQYKIKMNGVESLPAWHYPTEFASLRSAQPEFYAPDFMQMIKDQMKLYDHMKEGPPHVFDQ